MVRMGEEGAPDFQPASASKPHCAERSFSNWPTTFQPSDDLAGAPRTMEERGLKQENDRISFFLANRGCITALRCAEEALPLLMNKMPPRDRQHGQAK